MRHGDHRVTVTSVGMTVENAFEIMMLFTDGDGRHGHRPAQQRRAAFADGSASLNAVTGLIFAGVESAKGHAFELIDTFAIVLKRFELGKGDAFRRNRRRRVLAFADVDADDIPFVNTNGVCFDFGL